MQPDPELTRQNLQVVAAEIYREARVKDFDAAMLAGTRSEIERARLGAIAAAEAVLDAKQAAAWTLLKSMGLDPEERP